MMGAVTTEWGQVKSGQGTHVRPGGTGKMESDEPSLLRVHARDICAMLRLRFLASSSTLAGGEKSWGGGSGVRFV